MQKYINIRNPPSVLRKKVRNIRSTTFKMRIFAAFVAISLHNKEEPMIVIIYPTTKAQVLAKKVRQSCI